MFFFFFNSAMILVVWSSMIIHDHPWSPHCSSMIWSCNPSASHNWVEPTSWLSRLRELLSRKHPLITRSIGKYQYVYQQIVSKWRFKPINHNATNLSARWCRNQIIKHANVLKKFEELNMRNQPSFLFWLIHSIHFYFINKHWYREQTWRRKQPRNRGF